MDNNAGVLIIGAIALIGLAGGLGGVIGGKNDTAAPGGKVGSVLVAQTNNTNLMRFMGNRYRHSQSVLLGQRRF
jgi:hypothetical protein